MKAVLISIQPKWCELIASGKKTVEVRKTAPKLETPFKCYIYMTKNGNPALEIHDKDGNSYAIEKNYRMAGKVIGEFVCDCIDNLRPDYEPVRQQFFYNNDWENNDWNSENHCLTSEELLAYGKGKMLYGWHISDLKIYDKPRELSEFRKPCDRFLDCFLCRRYKRDEFGGCDSKIHRPPQSYMYVEEI